MAVGTILNSAIPIANNKQTNMGASAIHSYLYNRNQLIKLPATNHDDDGGSPNDSLSVQKRSELGAILTKPNQMKRNEKTEPHFGYRGFTLAAM